MAYIVQFASFGHRKILTRRIKRSGFKTNKIYIKKFYEPKKNSDS